jgi:tRNA/tmRNA/rRNA uracil-C5-methylase (TrmA/RlmC/RlmD family)
MDEGLAAILPLAGLAEDEQRELRRQRVVRALAARRLVADVPLPVPSPRPHGWRARVKLRRGPGGRLGFHRPGTHDWFEADLSPLARPELVATLPEVTALRTGPEVEVRTDGRRVVAVSGRSAFALDGGPTRLHVEGLSVGPHSFFQVNLEVNALVVAAVDARLLELAPVAILDLYGGVGNLSARAAGRGVKVTLVEREGPSCADARRNVPGATVLAKPAERLEPGEVFFDVAVLDPPRAGAPGLLPRLALTRPRVVLYLSCDPVSLARDLAALRGYRIACVRTFDMFPGTEHVETLVELERV